MRPGLDLKIEGIEVDTVVEEEPGVAEGIPLAEVEAPAVLIEADAEGEELK